MACTRSSLPRMPRSTISSPLSSVTMYWWQLGQPHVSTCVCETMNFEGSTSSFSAVVLRQIRLTYTLQSGHVRLAAATSSTLGTRGKCDGNMGRPWVFGFLAPRFFGFLPSESSGFAPFAAGAHKNGSSICNARIASLGGRLRDLLASFFISSVLRSRIFINSATIAATNPATAPFWSISSMNFLTAPRSGSIGLVIDRGFSPGADTLHLLCQNARRMERDFDHRGG